jgi:hypothetical protein
MGRKSLLKSTTKKPTAKKKAAPKESVQASEPKKRALKQQTKASKATASAKKVAAAGKPKAEPNNTAQTKVTAATVKPKAKEKIVTKAAAKPKAKQEKPAKAKESTAAAKPKVSLKDLVFRKFQTAPTKTVPGPPQKKAAIKIPDAPPFVTGYGKEETQRIRALLFKNFDLKAKPVTEKAEKAATAKKAKVSPTDLVFRKFQTAPTKTAARPPQKKAAVKIPDAPPFVTGYGKEETQRIRALLFKNFDLKAKPLAAAKKEAGRDKAAMPSGAPLPEYMPPVSVLSQGSEGKGNAMKAGLAVLALLIVIILATSFSNRDKFYLKNAPGTLQVWRGKFAPTGTELVLSLEGMKAPNPLRDQYTKEEVYPMVFGHLQDQADAALEDSRGPDIAKMKKCLRQAETYAPTNELRRKVQLRLKGMDFIVLLYKADFALSKGTLADLKTAKDYLNEAESYAFLDYHRKLVAETRTAVDRQMAALKRK